MALLPSSFHLILAIVQHTSQHMSLMDHVEGGRVDKTKYYAVRRGRTKGIFESWPECQEQIGKYSNPLFKSFKTREEAENWLPMGARSTPANNRAGGQSTANGGPSAHTTVVARNCTGEGAGSVEDQAWATRDAAMQEQGTAHASGSNAASAALGAPPVAAAPPTRCDSAPNIIAGAVRAGERVVLLPGAQLQEGLYLLHFDGASRGNPGTAGAGAVLTHAGSGAEIAHLVHPLPYMSTNNEAEYCGLIMGLAAAVKLGIKQLHCRGDSQLVVSQVKGEWKVKAEHIQPYVDAAQRLTRAFLGPVFGRHLFNLKHVPREQNKVADRLSNVAVDMQL